MNRTTSSAAKSWKGLSPMTLPRVTHQRLAVDPIRLRLAPAARHKDRCRIDDVALNPLANQDAMNPEPIQAGLLDGDNRKESVQTSGGFLLKLSEPSQQTADIAGAWRH